MDKECEAMLEHLKEVVTNEKIQELEKENRELKAELRRTAELFFELIRDANIFAQQATRCIKANGYIKEIILKYTDHYTQRAASQVFEEDAK